MNKPEISKEVFVYLLEEITESFIVQAHNDYELEQEISDEALEKLTTYDRINMYSCRKLVDIVHKLMNVPNNNNSLIQCYLYVNNFENYDFYDHRYLGSVEYDDLDEEDKLDYRLVYGKSFGELYDIVVREQR